MLLVSGSVGLVSSLAPRYPGLLGHITTPANNNGPASLAASGLPWAADNGCFHGFDAESFTRLVERVAVVDTTRLLWVVCPDVVADARATLALWPWWSAVIRSRGLTPAFVLQDGQENEPLPDADAYFIGGSTRWKLSPHAAQLAGGVKAAGKWLHMGRCNTQRRLQAAFDMGCDSVDGSIFSRMSDKFLLWGLRFLHRLHRQQTLFGEPTTP